MTDEDTQVAQPQGYASAGDRLRAERELYQRIGAPVRDVCVLGNHSQT